MTEDATKDGGRSGRRPPVVTIAALYGAGGSVVGPQVAERLGVPLLDRKIPQDVARRTGLSEQSVDEVDDEPRTFPERVTRALARAANLTGDSAAAGGRPDLQAHSLRSLVEDAMARLSASGGVAIGRGGMVVLADVPGALHVYLGGSPDARVERRMALDGIDRKTAERRREAEDRARIRYVQDAYGVDGTEPSLYHLMIDSMAIDLDTCVELIVAASRARTGRTDAGSTSAERNPTT